MELRYVDLSGAAPDDVVVVIDVLRAFTTVPYLADRGVARIVAVDTPERAMAVRANHLPGALLAGEVGGEPLAGFDLGNSPTEIAGTPLPLDGATVVHRTSAGTQGLIRAVGSGALFAASFVTARATARAVAALRPSRVTFVVTGASMGRDGDEDLAAAELIAARIGGWDPDPVPFLARVATSDAGRNFTEDGPSWAPTSDLDAATEVDRFATTFQAVPSRGGLAEIGEGETPVVELAAG